MLGVLLILFTSTSEYEVRKVSEVLRPRSFVIFVAGGVANLCPKGKNPTILQSKYQCRPSLIGAYKALIMRMRKQSHRISWYGNEVELLNLPQTTYLWMVMQSLKKSPHISPTSKLHSALAFGGSELTGCYGIFRFLYLQEKGWKLHCR